MGRKRGRDTFVCPHCGATVPVGAPSCRECGSDDETGWSDDEDGQGADDDDFDYDEYLERNHPDHASIPAGRSLVRGMWIIVVVLLCLAILCVFLRF